MGFAVRFRLQRTSSQSSTLNSLDLTSAQVLLTLSHPSPAPLLLFGFPKMHTLPKSRASEALAHN